MKLPKKPKLRSMKAITRELWELCRQITFKTHGRNCFTCPQTALTAMNLQCGHGHPKGACGASMAYDLRLLRPQCYQCNINYGGMGGVFRANIEKEIGKKATDDLYLEAQRSKGKSVNARDHYTNLIAEYRVML